MQSLEPILQGPFRRAKFLKIPAPGIHSRIYIHWYSTGQVERRLRNFIPDSLSLSMEHAIAHDAFYLYSLI